MPPTVFFDCEFQFASGASLLVTAQEGRDVIEREKPDYVRLELNHDPTTSEQIVVYRSALACSRIIRREVAADMAIEDAGRVKVEGELAV